MRPTYQTDTTDVTGNCIQAAIASLLELSIDEVPRFEPTNYLAEMVKFFNSRGHQIAVGLRADVPLIRDITKLIAPRMAPAYCLLGVRSFHHPRVDHCVVGQWNPEAELGVEVAFDPNPSNQERRSDEYEIKELDVILPVHHEFAVPLLRLVADTDVAPKP